MSRLIATVFNYSLDGLLSDPGTDYYAWCFTLPENQQPDDPAQLEFLRTASAHVFGRVSYQDIWGSMTRSPNHPFAPILEAGRKVVFSRTMTSAGWANSTIASGDTAEEVARLKESGPDDGHVIVWGGVGLWRSLMQLDLLDELQLSMFPYVAGEGTRLFDGVPSSYALELVSSSSSPSGILELLYRRPR
ncbi:MAG: dihydrofolate reductase family protein [Lapillicoccus sp.]